MPVRINFGNGLKTDSGQGEPKTELRENKSGQDKGLAGRKEGASILANRLRTLKRNSGDVVDGDSPHESKNGLVEPFAELERLVGLTEVKEIVKELSAYLEIQKHRIREHLVTSSLMLHMIFKGNPGTGKTTVARILGRLFKEYGILDKGHLVEIERADLVGEYIGHTATKTREQIKKALGGILFIDEAYSLARGGEKDFGKESIDVLVKAMEDHKEDMVIILAGYNREMEIFLQCNPGLRSRFPLQLVFPDYNVVELMRIADLLLEDRDYCLSLEARRRMEFILRRQAVVGHPHDGNARMVRNLLERAMRRQAVRLQGKPQLTREELILLTDADLEAAATGHRQMVELVEGSVTVRPLETL